MHRLISLIFFISVVFLLASQGTAQQKFFSKSLEEEREIFIYLPSGYNQADTTTRYPVVYFLHGWGLELSFFIDWAPFFLSGIFEDGDIQPFIIVAPDGNAQPYDGSFYTNSELYGRFEDYVVEDVIEFIDTNYNTRTSREYRAIMGHSMGGFGAMKIALKYPEKFRVVAAHSGPLDFSELPIILPSLLAEYDSGLPYTFSPDAGTFSSLAFAMAGAFSPNLNNQPHPVDFAVNSDGLLVDSVFARWLTHNPAALVKTQSQLNDLAIYFDCGTEDNLLVYPLNTAFADTLTHLNLEYTFHSFTGRHSDQLLTRFPISFAFIDSVFKSNMVSVSTDNETLPVDISLLQNYPNPFNPSTTIEFLLPKSEYTDLSIFNLLGQKVATLHGGYLKAGKHKFNWQAESQAAGIYFYQLKTESFTATRRLTLIK